MLNLPVSLHAASVWIKLVLKTDLVLKSPRIENISAVDTNDQPINRKDQIRY